jgi:hypothetical protein
MELPDWLDKFYNHSLNEILTSFDQNAHKVAGSGCISTGLYGLKTAELYQESTKKKAKTPPVVR